MTDLVVVALSRSDRLRQWTESPVDFRLLILPSYPFSQRAVVGARPVHLVRRARSMLVALKPDTIIIGGWNQPAFWSALRPPRRWRTSLWVESTMEDARPSRPLLTKAKRMAVSLADSYVVPGTASKSYLEHLGARGPIHVAPNAVDVSFIAEHAKRSEATTALRAEMGVRHLLLFVGRPEYKKGIDVAIEVVDRLGKEVGLVVAGEAFERAEWMRRVEQAGLAGRVRFEGFVGPERVAGLMGSADLFIFPSRSDPWGLVINEAQAAGCPVVTSPLPGAAADLSGNGAAAIVDLQPSVWAEEVSRLLNDPGRRREMSKQGLRMSRGYTPEACARGLASVLDET